MQQKYAQLCFQENRCKNNVALWRVQAFGSSQECKRSSKGSSGSLGGVQKHKDIAVCKKKFQGTRAAEEKAFKIRVSGWYQGWGVISFQAGKTHFECDIILEVGF